MISSTLAGFCGFLQTCTVASVQLSASVTNQDGTEIASALESADAFIDLMQPQEGTYLSDLLLQLMQSQDNSEQAEVPRCSQTAPSND